MQFSAEQKYLLISPRKARLVVDAIKRLSPQVAVEVLSQMRKSAAEPVGKVIKSAMANAKNKGISDNNLIFSEIQVGEGPRLRRGNPVSRGMWHPVKKQMSHIRVVLTEKSENLNPKSETTSMEPKKDKKKGEPKLKLKVKRSKPETKLKK